MKKKLKRIISVLLVLSMVLVMPLDALGQSLTNNVNANTEQTQTEQNSSQDIEKTILYELTDKRDSHTKHFLMSDGTMMAAQYENAVHFKTQNGWEQYDNSMIIEDETVSDKNKEYVNKKSDQTVKFAKKAKANKTVTYKYQDYEISWGYQNSEKAELEFVNASTEKSGNDRFLVLDNIAQQAKYAEIFTDVDLDLTVSSVGVKENFILNSTAAQNEFVIQYKLKNLTAEQKNEKTIVLKNADGEEVYTLSAPIMYDAEGNASDAITYVITEQKNNAFTVTLTADSAWLYDETRVYPVTVDPQFTTALDSNDPVRSAIATDYDNILSSNMLFVGYDEYIGRAKSMLYSSWLVHLSMGDIVTKAYAGVYSYYNNTFSSNLYISEITSLPSSIKNATGTSLIEIGYNDFSHSTVIEDYIPGDSLTNDYVFFDITNLFKEWLAGTKVNNGVVIWTDSQTQVATFKASNTQDIPCFTVLYYNTLGIEDYWTYHSESIGHGTLNLNDYSGNIVYSLPLIAATGERNPVSLSLVYNSAVAGEYYACPSTYTVTGKGWQSNFDMAVTDLSTYDTESMTEHGWGVVAQRLDSETPIDSLVLTDSDGTQHFFHLDPNTGNYVDESGSGSTMTKNSSGFILNDRSGFTYNFNISGRLTSYSDINGNTVTLTYNSSGGKTTITDASGRAYILNYQKYNLHERITSIHLTDGKDIYLEYSGANLYKVTYPDGSYTTFSYYNDILIGVQDFYGNSVSLSYEAAQYTTRNQYYRCTNIQSFAGIENTGELDIEYNTGLTTTFKSITPLAPDGIVEIYTFDECGRTITVYNQTEGYCSNYNYTSNATNSPDKNNKVTAVQPGGKIAENLLKNTNSDAFSSWSVFEGCGYSNEISVSCPNTAYLGYGNNICLVADTNQKTGYAKKVTISTNTDYTFSVRVKSGNNDCGIAIATEINGQKEIFAEEYYNSAVNDFQTLSVTYTGNSSCTEIWLIIFVKGQDQGADFDSPQLELGATVNELNIVSSNFDNWNMGGTDVYWNGGNLIEVNNSTTTDSFYASEIAIVYTDIKSFEFTVALDGCQTQALENKPNAKFSASITLYCTDYSSVTETKNFNTYTDGMQMLTVGARVSDDKTVNRIEVRIDFSGLIGELWVYDVALRVNESGVSYTYDDKGNLTKDVNAKGNGSNTVYTEKNQPFSIRTENGDFSEYFYEDNGYNVSEMFNEIDTSDGTGYLGTFYSYNEYGSVTETLIAQTDEDNSLILNDHIDDYINPDMDAPHIRSSVTYDDVYNQYVIATTDARGNTTSSTITPSNGRLNSVTDPKGNTTTYHYNNQDILTSVTGSNTTAHVNYGYDSKNRLISVGNDSQVYYFDYDAVGRNYRTRIGQKTLSTTEYISGTSLPSRVFYGNDATIYYTYDKYGRVITKTPFDTTVSPVVQYIYNNGGQIGRLVEDIYGADWYDGIFDYTYDNSGRLTRSTGGGLTKAIKYDIFDRVNVLSYLVGNTTFKHTYTYGKNNALKNESLDGYYTINYNYDSLGRVTTKSLSTDAYIYSDGLDVPARTGNYVYTYVDGYNEPGETGATTTLVSGLTTPLSESTFGYTYDQNGNILTETSNVFDNWESLKEPHSKQYTYDALGQLTKSISDQKVTEYTYDNAGNILSEKVHKNDSTYGTSITTEQESSSIHYYGTWATVSSSHVSNGSLVRTRDSAAYATLDFTGTKLTLLTYRSPTRGVLCYQIDNGEIIEYDCTAEESDVWFKYEVVLADNLDPFKTHTVRIFPKSTNGNLWIDIDALIATNGDQTVATYTYGNESWGDQLTAFNGQTITYDDIGNPLSYKGASLGWTNGRQLLQYTKDGLDVRFKYNSEGVRISKTVTGILNGQNVNYRVEYVVDGSTILSEKKFDLTTNTYVSEIHYFYDSNGEIMGHDDVTGNYRYFYEKNLQGDVIGKYYTYSGSQPVGTTYCYDDWGNIYHQYYQTSDPSGFYYRGYYYDHETGLYYLNSRYYDSQTHRFVNADGLIDNRGLHTQNLYAYCANNPVNYVDPEGEFWKFVSDNKKFVKEKIVEPIRKYASNIVEYDVPQYYQGKTNLCWAYCQLMVEDFQRGKKTFKFITRIRAVVLAYCCNGVDWNRANWPTNCKEYDSNNSPVFANDINSIEDLYGELKNNGPIYALYSDYKTESHLVGVTGVNLNNGTVYTNNPNNPSVSGVQSYSEFLNNYTGYKRTTPYPLGGYIRFD